MNINALLGQLTIGLINGSFYALLSLGLAVIFGMLNTFKFRNAGQVCTSPTRILVHKNVYNEFKNKLTAQVSALKVGNGMDIENDMGPLANPRRLQAMEMFTSEAVERGGKLLAGGRRIGNQGNFFEPTILEGVPENTKILNEEPFGPIMTLHPLENFDEMIAEANRLPYGLAAYAYTRSARTAAKFSEGVEAGMVSINHHGLGPPETPFGGVKDSGYGSEGGSEALDAYLVSKFITHSIVD